MTYPGANIPKFEVWRQQSDIFQQVARYNCGGAEMNLTGSDHPQQVQGIHVTAEYFALFGAPVVVGRTFTASEDSPNGGHVAILSYGLWTSRYAGNPQIVGSTIELDGQPYLVVGVIGKSFITDSPADLWVPFQFDPASVDMAHYFTVAARLRPGVTVPQANAKLRLAVDQYRRTYGSNAIPPQGRFGVLSLQGSVIGDSRSPLFVLADNLLAACCQCYTCSEFPFPGRGLRDESYP